MRIAIVRTGSCLPGTVLDNAEPGKHPGVSMPGMHGSVAAVAAMQGADLPVSLGARFDGRVTGKSGEFSADATVVHADIDPAEISKNRKAYVPIVGTAPKSSTSCSRLPRRRKSTPAGPATTKRSGRLLGRGVRRVRWVMRGPPTAVGRRSTWSGGSVS